MNFTNPLDGGPTFASGQMAHWERRGEDFDTLVLRPSILSTPPYGCGWHGFVGGVDGTQPGEVVTV